MLPPPRRTTPDSGDRPARRPGRHLHPQTINFIPRYIDVLLGVNSVVNVRGLQLPTGRSRPHRSHGVLSRRRRWPTATGCSTLAPVRTARVCSPQAGTTAPACVTGERKLSAPPALHAEEVFEAVFDPPSARCTPPAGQHPARLGLADV